MALAAMAIGTPCVLLETIIATLTLLSGYWSGLYDVAGVGFGIAAIILVWKRPILAVILWAVEEVMLYNGHLLVSVACLPVLLLPVSSAGFALAWFFSKRRVKG